MSCEEGFSASEGYEMESKAVCMASEGYEMGTSEHLSEDDDDDDFDCDWDCFDVCAKKVMNIFIIFILIIITVGTLFLTILAGIVLWKEIQGGTSSNTTSKSSNCNCSISNL